MDCDSKLSGANPKDEVSSTTVLSDVMIGPTVDDNQVRKEDVALEPKAKIPKVEKVANNDVKCVKIEKEQYVVAKKSSPEKRAARSPSKSASLEMGIEPHNSALAATLANLPPGSQVLHVDSSGLVRVATTTKLEGLSGTRGASYKGTPRANVTNDQKNPGMPPKKPRRKKKVPPEKDELLKCEVCGCYGLTSEFCASGRFCSQRCVGAHASKCRATALAAAAAAAAASGLDTGKKDSKKRKKKRRKTFGKTLSRKTWSSKRALMEAKLTDSVDDPFDLLDIGYDDSPNSGGSKGTGNVKLGRAAECNSNKVVNDDSMTFYNSVQYSTKFDWELYLKTTKTTAVPIEIFAKENPFNLVFPSPASEFQARMKLEAIDPKHQSCLCVVSVVEVKGCRLRLHFDGWSESYDFWTNADSPFLFPAGWSDKNSQAICPPRGIMKTDFNWNIYLRNTKSVAAPGSLFREIRPPKHGFEIGMKLEAVDRKNPDLICVASVTNIIGEHLLIHFDNWDDTYDYWCQNDCPYIHPIGWCDSVGLQIIPPQDDEMNTFKWDEYLRLTDSKAAMVELFVEKSPSKFAVGKKLEAIDPRNASLTRVATVAGTEDNLVKVHFDGWDYLYDYWFDSDSTDLHPIGWCEHTGHPIEPPPSPFKRQDPALCPTRGCRGVGHVKGAKYTTHHSIFGCPYSPQNLERGSPLVDRLASNSMGEEASVSVRIHKTPVERSSEDSESEQNANSNSSRVMGRPTKKPGDIASLKTAKMMAAISIKSKYNSAVTRTWQGNDMQGKRSQDGRVLTERMPTNSLVSNSAKQHPDENGTSAARGSRDTFCKVTSSSSSGRKQTNQQQNSQAMRWNVADVVDFIESIGCQEHAHRFEEQQIDGEALLLLSQGDMIRHLSMKLGPTLKIYNEIRKL